MTTFIVNAFYLIDYCVLVYKHNKHIEIDTMWITKKKDLMNFSKLKSERRPCPRGTTRNHLHRMAR